MKGLELDRDLHAPLGGVAAQFPDGVDAEGPLLGRGDHLTLPDILAEHQQQVRAAQFGGQVEKCPAAVEVEAADGGIEVDKAERHAAQADDRQVELAAGLADQPPLGPVDVERVGEDVDRVEAEPLGRFQAEAGSLAGLGEGRVDEAEFHEA